MEELVNMANWDACIPSATAEVALPHALAMALGNAQSANDAHRCGAGAARVPMRPHDRNESDDDRPIPPRRIASAVRPPPLRRYTVHQPLGAKQPYGWSARARELIAASGSHQSRTGTGVVRPSSESGALGETVPMAARCGHAMHRHLDGYRIGAARLPEERAPARRTPQWNATTSGCRSARP